MSFPESGILLLALTQSQQAWTTTLFPKAPDLLHSFTLVDGKPSIIIGPHTFPEIQFFVRGEVGSPSTLPTLFFSFKESPNDRLMFPQNAVVEETSLSKHRELKVSFPLSNLNTSNDSLKTDDEFVMHIINVSDELFDLMKMATHDPSLLFSNLIKRITFFSNKPLLSDPLATMEPNPCSAKMEDSDTNELILIKAGIDKTPSVVKRKDLDNNVSTKIKKPRLQKTTPKKSGIKTPKSKALSLHSSSTSFPATSNGLGSLKKCGYCGCKSTPMWRRGPDGAGTLCNACGVKWKHGKILQGYSKAPVKGNSMNSVPFRSESHSSSVFSSDLTPPLSRSSSKAPRPRRGSNRRESSDREMLENIGKKEEDNDRRSSSHYVDLDFLNEARITSNDSGTNGQVKKPLVCAPLKKRKFTKALGQVSGASVEKGEGTGKAYGELSSVSSSAVSSPQIPTSVIPSIPDHLVIQCRNICFGNSITFHPQPTCGIKLFDVYWQIHVSEEGSGDNCITFTYSIIDQVVYGMAKDNSQGTVPEASKNVQELKVVVPQYLTRFGKELLNPEQEQTTIVFQFGQPVTLHSLKSYFGNGRVDYCT